MPHAAVALLAAIDHRGPAPRAITLPARCVTPLLTRFQQVLLGTDGTVTNLLEAYAGEPVEVVKLRQVFDTSNDADADLMAAGGDVLRRRVLLRGRRGRQRLLYAEAVLAVERVDAPVLEALLSTDKAIGVVLAEHRIETFREILRVGSEPAGPTGAHFGVDASAELISRTYRIIAGGQPVILITEKFPANLFRDLPA